MSLVLSKIVGHVGIARLNRPEALNALCDTLFHQLNTILDEFQQNSDIGAIVITGSEKAFAAGADIKEMSETTYTSNYLNNFLSHWDHILSIKKPIIAAVNGYALGGGCELAMMCDIIYASNDAKFGQPEVKIGTIPGGGGTQRLIKAIGKSRAMEMILSGNPITASEAESFGLISKTFEASQVLNEAIKLGEQISKHSQVVVAMCKEAVNISNDLGLKSGLHFEKRLFQSTFALNDQKEGMRAFLEKRKPFFTHK